MSLFSPRRSLAPCCCAPLLLACGLLMLAVVMPAQAQQLPAIAAGAPPVSDAQSERAFWSEQEELSAAERATLGRNVEVLSKRGYTRWSEKLWNDLRSSHVANSERSVGELELSDPALAVAFYGNWLSGNTAVATRDLELRVRVASLVAQLLANDLNDARKALAVYDWSLALLMVGADPSWQRLALERDHLILAQRGQARQATTVELNTAEVQWAGAVPDAVTPLEAPSAANVSTPSGLIAVPTVKLTDRATSKRVVVNPFASLQTDAFSSAVTLATDAASHGRPLAGSDATSEAARLVRFGSGIARRDAAIAQIKAGTLTPEDAWQSGALTYENIADLLESAPDVYVIHFQGEDRSFYHQLIELLLKYESARFDALEKIPQRVRLWLADYYQSQGNQKAIVVAESIVVEYQQPTKGAQDIVFQALEREAWFYQGQRKYELAAQMWMRVPSYVTNTAWMIPEAVWQAGRMYLWAEKPEAAESYFAQVAQRYGNPWLTCIALHDQSNFLLSSDHIDDAQSLLDRWKQKYSNLLLPYIVPLIEGDIAMRRGQWDHAHSSYLRATDEFRNLPRDERNPGDLVFLSSMTQGLEWSQVWMERPFVCDRLDMTAVVERDVDGTAKQSWDVRVDSARLVQFKVECSDPRVRITVDTPTKNTFGCRSTISIDVTLKSSEDYIETEIQVFPEDHPEQVVKLPLFIEVK